MTPEQKLIQARLSVQAARNQVAQATSLLANANATLDEAVNTFAAVSQEIYGRTNMRLETPWPY